jgi:dGTPase
MREYGGFEHNLQSLRVVDVLEERYAAFDGLNLCYETREGIIKHVARKSIPKLGSLGERFLQHKRPSLEAQLANFADEIAYNNHDVDDGLRSGLITLEQLREVSIFSRHLSQVQDKYPGLAERRMVRETVRSMINTLVTDIIQQSLCNIKDAGIESLTDVHTAPALIGFSQQIKKEQQELKKFLFDNLYRHFRVMRMSNKARHTIEKLFAAFSSEVQLLPVKYQKKFELEGYQGIADYIAGMTDRYAIKEYQRLFTIAEN